MSTKTATAAPAATETSTERPWWKAGGILQPGQRFNIHFPAFFLAWYYNELTKFLIFWVSFHLFAKYVNGMKTETCLYSFPSYLGSAVAVWFHMPMPTLFQIFCVVIASIKVAICSSACLHRYCAHTAYKTDNQFLKIFICIVGCLANQGGPIWWASQHRCHHKHCETVVDPHSPTVMGFENAFAFFNARDENMKVNKDYVPHYIDEDIFWIIDTFYWAFCTLEMIVAWYFYGMVGVAASYISGWECQLGGMYFNVIFHLSEENGSCQGIDAGQYWTNVPVTYPGFFILSCIVPFSAPFSGEYYHHIHHEQPQLAYRNLLDLGWYLFIWPLQSAGMIYDVCEGKKTL